MLTSHIIRYEMAKHCLKKHDPLIWYCAQWLGNLHFTRGLELFKNGSYSKSGHEFALAQSFQVSYSC